MIDDGMCTVVMQSPDTPLDPDTPGTPIEEKIMKKIETSVNASQQQATREKKKDRKMTYNEAKSEVKVKLLDDSSDWITAYGVASSEEVRTAGKVPIAVREIEQKVLSAKPPPPKPPRSKQQPPPPPRATRRDYLIASDLTGIASPVTMKHAPPMDRGLKSPQDDGLALEEAR